MKDVFITSTLQSDWNIKFNLKICKALEKRGISCYLPQRDTNQDGNTDEKFNQNIEGIKNAKNLLVIALNETPNWGAEIGFARGINKKIFALTSEDHNIPLMTSGMINKVLRVGNLAAIESYIDKLISIIKNN